MEIDELSTPTKGLLKVKGQSTPKIEKKKVHFSPTVNVRPIAKVKKARVISSPRISLNDLLNLYAAPKKNKKFGKY